MAAGLGSTAELSRTLVAVSDPVRQALRAAIADHGPISFAEFMELALYGPGGFYEGPPIGEGGHFVTSPHVHPLFARLLARALSETWRALGCPDPFSVLELGAGDGTLARTLIADLAGSPDGVPVRYMAVERSPGARERLRRLGLRVVPSVEAAPTRLTGCVVANELLDNLPFHWLRGTAEGTVEVRVDVAVDGFAPVTRPWAPADADADEETDDDAALSPDLAPGEDRAYPRAALRMIERIPRLLASGYALFIDYAAPVPAGPLLVHGYRRHRVVEDVLADPGTADITAGVDLPSIVARAEGLGLRAFPLVSQRSALEVLGHREWMAAERHRQGALLDAHAARDAVQAWSGRNAAALLVDPAGLGRLRWLVLATQGLPAPSWLVRAAEIDAEGR